MIKLLKQMTDPDPEKKTKYARKCDKVLGSLDGKVKERKTSVYWMQDFIYIADKEMRGQIHC